MAWCNNFTAPEVPLPDVYGPDPYDLNIAFPLSLKTLENDRVKLTPFIPRLHAAPYFEEITAHPDIYRFLTISAPTSVEDLCTCTETLFRRNPGFVWFAIFDKTRAGTREFEQAEGGGGGLFAGAIGLINTSVKHLSTELGYVVIFPSFQRTHVLSNAAGLLLNYCLNLPSDPTSPGLGFRRVEWVANTLNVRSIAAAGRLGFRREATFRWHWLLPEGKEGHEPREGDPAGRCRPGRDNAVLSICWDDWVNGAKAHVESLMTRKS